MGLSVKKVKARCGGLHLKFCGSPSCLSGHQLFIYVFHDRCKWSIYRICKYDLGNLILLQNKSNDNNNNNNNNNNSNNNNNNNSNSNNNNNNNSNNNDSKNLSIHCTLPMGCHKEIPNKAKRKFVLPFMKIGKQLLLLKLGISSITQYVDNFD